MTAVTHLAGFTATLRDSGFRIGGSETADAARILASPYAERPARLRRALRALFCADRAQWQKFDAVFDAYWLARGVKRVSEISGAATREGPRTIRQLAEAGAPRNPRSADDPQRRAEDGQHNPADGHGRHEGASRSTTLDHTDFRYLTDAQRMQAAHEAAERLSAVLQVRARRHRTRRRGTQIDMRKTIRSSVAHGGVPVARRYRVRREQPLKLVVMLDASGSMSVYTAVFTRFIHGVIGAFARADAFVFHTRLVQISGALRDRDFLRAIDRLSLLAHGVGGGTRIGESLSTFNSACTRTLTLRTVVMIFSDGYDTGEPGELGDAMRTLARRCRRIVWLNPLLGWTGYEPRARGMAEALPYIKLFAPAHDLQSLRRLEPYFAKL